VEGVPIPGTYQAAEPSPQGLGAIAKAAFSGFYDAVDVCLFILMVGGFLGVVMKSGAIDAGVSNVIARLNGREKWLIPILMLFFGLGGTTYGMWEETMAFFPLLLPVFLAAGYDAVVGVAVILLGAGGLTRAYSKSARDTLAAAGVSEMGLWATADIPCPYALFERVRGEVTALGGTVDSADYGADIRLTISLPAENTAALRDRLTELSAGGMVLTVTAEAYRPGPRTEL